jgi:copper chaperone CopZ
MKRELLNSLAIAAGVLVLATGGPWLVKELRTLPRAQTLAARAGQRVVMLDVGGMTCAGCASKVQGELATIAGVATAEVRLEQRRAFVVCERSVPDSALTAAVHRAGPGFLAAIATR